MQDDNARSNALCERTGREPDRRSRGWADTSTRGTVSCGPFTVKTQRFFQQLQPRHASASRSAGPSRHRMATSMRSRATITAARTRPGFEDIAADRAELQALF
jgi:hypothetical protein